MTQTAEIIPLPAPREPESERRERGRWSAAGTVLFAAALVAGCFARGLYDFWMWGALAACLFAIVVATAYSRSLVLTAPARLVAAGLGVLLALSALSMTWADSVDRAWVETNRVALYLAAFVVGCALVRSPGRRRVLALALAPLFGLVSLVVLIRLFAGDAAAFIDHRLDAPLDYINGSAGLLLMGLWPLAAVAERYRTPLVAGLGAAGVVVGANLLVLTQSRAVVPALLVSALALVAIVPGRTTRVWLLLACGAAVAAALPWTLDVYASRDALRPAAPETQLLRAAAVATAAGALAAGALWGLAMWLVKTQRFRRFGGVATGAAVLAVVGLLTAGAVAVDDPVTGLRTQWQRFTANEVDQTTTIRFADAGGRRYDLWRVAWREFEHDPVRGVGAGGYGLRYFQLRGTPEPVRQPHSLPLQLLAELGVGGALALCAIIAGLAWGLLRVRNLDRAVAVACGGLVISWLAHTSVDWLWNLPALTCLALLAGSALAMSPSRGSPAPGSGTRVTAVVAIVLVAFAAASLGRSYAADRLRAGAAGDVVSDPASALRESRRALVLNPANLETHYLRAAAFARLGAAGLAEDTLRQAIQREPRNFVPWALLGDLQVRRGRIEQARRAYARALELNPLEPELRLLVADPRRAVS